MKITILMKSIIGALATVSIGCGESRKDQRAAETAIRALESLTH